MTIEVLGYVSIWRRMRSNRVTKFLHYIAASLNFFMHTPEPQSREKSHFSLRFEHLIFPVDPLSITLFIYIFLKRFGYGLGIVARSRRYRGGYVEGILRIGHEKKCWTARSGREWRPCRKLEWVSRVCPIWGGRGGLPYGGIFDLRIFPWRPY
mgnify:CR=1 FL=1